MIRINLKKLNIKYQKNITNLLKNCAENWDDCKIPLIGDEEICDYLRNKGYRKYALSNASDKFYTYFPRFLPLDYFNDMLFLVIFICLNPMAKFINIFWKNII